MISNNNKEWPDLPLEKWRETCDTLHLLTQIAGKIRLGLMPPEPNWGHAGLFVSTRGITTGPIPYKNRLFEIEFDLTRHHIRIFSNDKQGAAIPLINIAVAEYYSLIMGALASLNIKIEIFAKPQEVPSPILFEEDNVHHLYDKKYAGTFWAALRQVNIALLKYRAPYRKRTTPVNFWWGTFDLSVSRFSGHPAEPPKGSGLIMRGAMDGQFVETGFWPGDDRFPEPAFYSFTYPQPENIENSKVRPEAAYWDGKLREFIMPYHEINKLPDPEKAVSEFCESTFSAGAKLGKF